MHFYNTGYIIGIIVSIVIAVWVVLNHSSHRENIIWSFLSILVGVWFLGRLMVYESSSAAEANAWQKVLYLGAIFLNVVYCHFVIEFLKKKNLGAFLGFGYALSALLFALNLTTNLFVRGMRIMPYVNYYEIAGPVYLAHVLIYLSYPGLGFFWLVVARSKEQGFKRNQIDYLILASLIGFACGLTSFPMVFNIRFPPLGAPFVGVYQFIIGYTIVKHRFMDISVIVRKTLIYSVVMGTLTIIYLAIIALGAHVFEGLTGYQTIFSSAVAAGLITVCFQPLRKRVQQFVDSKFFRQYVDREEKLYELSREVITHTTPEAMAQALMHVLQETLHPKAGALYLKSREGHGFEPTATWGDNLAKLVMPDDNALAHYFADHPQPFVQEIAEDLGAPQDTRNAAHNERNVA